MGLMGKEGLVFRDVFGVRWRVRLVGPHEKGSPTGSRAGSSVSRLRTILYFAFGPGAAHNEAQSATRENQPFLVLLSVYDALTGRRLSDELVGSPSSCSLLDLWRSEIEDTLVDAVRRGVLRFEEERAVPPSFVLDEEPLTERSLPQSTETRSFVALRVVDEVGDPIDGVDVAFGTGASRRVVPTDGSGVARLDDVATGFVSASLANVAQLREKLAPRWKAPRAAMLPTAPDVHVAQVDAAAAPLSLETETQATLAITPLFRCSELSGVHFAFARSFLLESALDTLSIMAAAIMEDENRRAMIFGHTDTAGSEALNKELSERRAKVIFAVLTHDTDAWEALWTGSADGANFKEQWGIKEAQHLLNALGVTDDEGTALVEDGIDGGRTHAALRRFQRGDYTGARAARGPLPETGKADKATREEFLFSFADLVTHDPIPKDRFSSIGGAPFMGCAEYNPLSDHARDAASRRTVIFVFDAAAEPQDLPCKLRNLGPCKGPGGVDEPLLDPLPDDKPYRCTIYREIAKTCPCVKGEELMHVVVQLHDSNFDPAPQTHYEMVIDGVRVFGETDSEGVLHAAVRKAEVTLRVTYQPSTEDAPLTIDARVLLPDEDETDRAFVQRIRNLGFGNQSDADEFAILKFQAAHKKLKRTGRLDDDTKQAVRDATDEPLRQSFDDGVRA